MNSLEELLKELANSKGPDISTEKAIRIIKEEMVPKLLDVDKADDDLVGNFEYPERAAAAGHAVKYVISSFSTMLEPEENVLLGYAAVLLGIALIREKQEEELNETE